MKREDYIKEHFPEVDPGVKPCGNQVLVQLKTTRSVSAGGIVLATETKEFNDGNTQVGRLVSVGQIAYKDRNTGEPWKEGAWAEVGDIVIIPRWGGFRFELPVPGTQDKAIFTLFEDFNMKLVVEGNFEAFDKLL